MRESKKSEGGGAFKAPPGRIGLNVSKCVMHINVLFLFDNHHQIKV